MSDKVVRDHCHTMMLEDWKEIGLLSWLRTLMLTNYCIRWLGVTAMGERQALGALMWRPCLKIKPEIKGFSSSCTCQPFATHGASGKQIWGNGSRALMPSDRYKARVAERVMADVGARRGCCLWQLKQLSLRAKRRVGARPRWWAGLHSWRRSPNERPAVILT